MAERLLHEGVVPGAGARGEVAGPGGVAAVGEEGRPVGVEVAGQVVVGQQHPVGAGGVLRLVLRHPAQLGGVMDATSTLPSSSAQAAGPPISSTSSAGLRRRAGVVPQQGVAHHGAVLVERDHPVLLAPDGDRGGLREEGPGGVVERGEPGPRVHLGPVRVGGAALREDLAGAGVDEERLGGLGGGVDAQDGGACHEEPRCRVGTERRGRRGTGRAVPGPAQGGCAPDRAGTGPAPGGVGAGPGCLSPGRP